MSTAKSKDRKIGVRAERGLFEKAAREPRTAVRKTTYSNKACGYASGECKCGSTPYADFTL